MSTLDLLDALDGTTKVQVSIPVQEVLCGVTGIVCAAAIARYFLGKEDKAAPAMRVAVQATYDVHENTNAHLASLAQSKEYQEWMAAQTTGITEKIEHRQAFFRSLYITAGCIYVAAACLGWFSIPTSANASLNERFLYCFIATAASFFLPLSGFAISALLGLSACLTMVTLAAVADVSHPGIPVVTAFSFIGPVIDFLDTRYNGPLREQLQLIANPQHVPRKRLFSFW